MVSKEQGKFMMEGLVKKYVFVEETLELIKRGLLSEQDITTKFILPMLEALSWDRYKFTVEGPEIHEKAYKEKSDVSQGLPDITLKSENGTVFVEVKRPGEISKGMTNLERYGDADLILLTTFEETRICTRYGNQEPRKRFEFNFKQYATKFDQLWKILSNSKKGKDTRAAIKATR